jgi:hypothetical protein
MSILLTQSGGCGRGGGSGGEVVVLCETGAGEGEAVEAAEHGCSFVRSTLGERVKV